MAPVAGVPEKLTRWAPHFPPRSRAVDGLSAEWIEARVAGFLAQVLGTR